MAGPRRIFKNLNLYFGGNSFAGNVLDFNPPKLELETQEHRAGGMDAALDMTMGLKKLDTEFSVSDFSPLLIGAISGREGADHSFIMRGALEDWDGTITACELIMRGKVKNVDRGTLKPGDKSQLKLTMNLNFYSETIGGQLVHEIDVINMTWVKGGIDSLQDIRSAIGL